LRLGGATQARACAELDVSSGRRDRLEAQFQRARLGGERVRPRFARHGKHVAAVLAAGGFPVLCR
ncbi:hypothetical protein, partial [Phenylobacterium sp.]|uniref:hypothetical protein n=1 Tax=Phenylobacterium sp. TaxID=1871053 RepID=UPI002ED7E90C